VPSASGRGSAVSARDLSIRYRTRNARSHVLAVGGVTIDVADGEALALMGDSGAGKSTLAAAVALSAGHGELNTGYPEICGGTLAVLGAGVRRMGPYRRKVLARRIGYLPQDGADRLSRISPSARTWLSRSSTAIVGSASTMPPVWWRPWSTRCTCRWPRLPPCRTS
jgi:ABC-type glutathione transport system ATPase component